MLAESGEGRSVKSIKTELYVFSQARGDVANVGAAPRLSPWPPVSGQHPRCHHGPVHRLLPPRQRVLL